MPQPLRKRYQDNERYPVFSSVQAAFVAEGDFPAGTVSFETAPFTVGNRRQARLAVRSFAHEPDFAPAGKTVLQVLVFQDAAACHEWQRLYRQPEAYKAAKTAVTDALTERIAARYPAASVRLLDCWTPATYNRYFDSYMGAYMAFAVTGRRQLPVAVPARVPGLSNVLLATQWQKTPGGLPHAALAGCRAAELLSAINQD